MASFASSLLPTIIPCTSSIGYRSLTSLSSRDGSILSGQRLFPKIQKAKAAKGLSPIPTYLKTRISCSIAQPETLQVVQEIIAKQLSLEESAVIPQTKFIDLGADSLDTVEIMMTLEEKFGVSIGEGGAENISTVQDAADLIQKVKAASS